MIMGTPLVTAAMMSVAPEFSSACIMPFSYCLQRSRSSHSAGDGLSDSSVASLPSAGSVAPGGALGPSPEFERVSFLAFCEKVRRA